MGDFFTGVYANLTRRFLHPEISRWRKDTGSNSIATKKDIKMISAAEVMYCGTPDPFPQVSTLSDFVE